MRALKSRYDSDIFEISRVVRKLETNLKRLQDQDDEDLRKERERNSWWAYLASSIYGKVDETDEQRQARDIGRLHRLASKNIKGSELCGEEAKLQKLQDVLQDVNGKIAAEMEKVEDEARAHIKETALRMEQEARNRAQQEMREKWAKAEKEQTERTAKAARDAQEAQERAQKAREAQERVRKAVAAERHRRETEERVQRMQATEEAAQKAKGASDSKRSTCKHGKFWPKVEGRHLYCNCHTVQTRFAFRCPSCEIIACASCRQTFRGEKRKGFGFS